MKEKTQEELLHDLEEAHKKYCLNEQAYTQLKKIVKEYHKLMRLWEIIAREINPGESVLGTLREALQQKPIVTKEWVEDLKDLFFDWEHRHDEPIDRLDGQKSTDETWGEIVETFGKIGLIIEK